MTSQPVHFNHLVSHIIISIQYQYKYRVHTFAMWPFRLGQAPKKVARHLLLFPVICKAHPFPINTVLDLKCYAAGLPTSEI